MLWNAELVALRARQTFQDHDLGGYWAICEGAKAFSGHSFDVYENNYMTKRVRVNLAYCRLKDLAGSSELLFEIVRDVSLQTDPGAPIDLNEDQLRYTESRNDTTKLTAKHTAAKESGDAKKLKQTRAALELHKRQVGALLI
ncbi:hypothetical protein F4802DRAFT_602834 [Xylaria palmicola]|nr:hypothetical protein F4802DRAFT_602834 [Xylaria palmicola]